MQVKKSILIILLCNIVYIMSCRDGLKEQSSSSPTVDCNTDGYIDFAEHLLETLNILDLSTEEETLSKLTSDIKEGTTRLAKGEININSYLTFLLKIRYEYLASRSETVKNYLLDNSGNTSYVVPTSKLLSTWLDKDAAKDGNENHEKSRFLTAQIYEILNMFIRDSYTICEQDKLNEEATKLLENSKQLHPILNNEQFHLGHPDEACSYYAILEHFFPTYSQKSTEFPELRKLYTQVKREVQKCIGQENNPGETHRRLLLGSFAKAIDQHIKQDKGSKSALFQEISAIEKEMDVKIYTSCLASKDNISNTKVFYQVSNYSFLPSNSTFSKENEDLNATKAPSKSKKRRRNRAKAKAKYKDNTKKDTQIV